MLRQSNQWLDYINEVAEQPGALQKAAVDGYMQEDVQEWSHVCSKHMW
jgi:hypothetical protein